MPLTILFVERAWREGGRRIISAAAVAALQMLSGAPEIILMTWLMLGTLWLIQMIRGLVALKRSVLRLGAVAAAVMGLCAIQILPFLELLAQSDRQADGGTGAWSLPVWGLANLFVPLFRCSRSIIGPYFQIEQQWTTSIYPGIVILMLAAAAIWMFGAVVFKNRRAANSNLDAGLAGGPEKIWVLFLLGWAVLGVLLALGDHFILYPLLKRVIPGFGFIRYPIKFLIPTIFSLPLLAAFAVTSLFVVHPSGCLSSTAKATDTLKQETLRRRFAAVLVSSGLALALVIVVVVISKAFPYREEVWSVTAWNAAARAAFLASGLGLLLALSKEGRLAGFFAAGLLVLLGLDAVTHMPRQNPTVSARAFGQLDLGMSATPTLGKARAMVSPEVEALLRRAALPDRFAYYAGNRRTLFEDCNLVECIPKINGFFSLHVSKQQAVNALIYGDSSAPSPTGFIDFLGVSQVSSKTNTWEWVSRSSTLPLVTAGQQPVFAGREETLGLLADPSFDGRKIVCLPPESRADFGEIKTASVQVEMVESRAHKNLVRTDSQSPSILVLAQTDYPAWRASVDGHPMKIWTANFAFQAIQVPAGKHQISFEFRDQAFEWGAIVTCLSIAGCAVCWWRNRSITLVKLA